MKKSEEVILRMLRVVRVLLVAACVAQAHAKDSLVNHNTDAWDSVDKVHTVACYACSGLRTPAMPDQA